ncbi:MAG: hypothetical protein JNK38_00915 [Acidobacteria bacterium]|nr:hypothetical protein [Acidobacteriota bacterium]
MSKMSLLDQGIFSGRPGNNEIENLYVEDAAWRLQTRSTLILTIVRGEFVYEAQRRGSKTAGKSSPIGCQFPPRISVEKLKMSATLSNVSAAKFTKNCC